MQNIPKIVAERLRAAPVSTEHPDPDVLTAFSERLLPERERNSVLGHLARCGECREIVALALPASEPVEKMVRRASIGWLTWPVLRWGFVAAGIVAITSVGIMQYRRQNAHQPVAALYDATRSDTTQPESVAKEARNQVPPVAGEPAKSDAKLQTLPASDGAVAAPGEPKPAAPKRQARDFDRLEAYSRLQAPSAGSGSVGRAPLPHGPSVGLQTQQNNFYANNSQQEPPPPPAYARQQPSAGASANAPAPTAPNAVEISAASAPVQGQNHAELVLPSKSMPLQPTEGGRGEFVERAKSPDSLVSSTKVPADTHTPPKTYASGKGEGAQYAANTRWAINSAGSLQRSVDQGGTWQDVNVNGAPSAGASLDLTMKALRTSTAETDKADKDKKVNEAPPMVFRAVSANGTDVWAGGSAGLLYHSTDAGAHWTRVIAFSQGAILTGDIVSLEFSDTQNGRLTTSLAHVWTTTDGGQTWQKQ